MSTNGALPKLRKPKVATLIQDLSNTNLDTTIKMN